VELHRFQFTAMASQNEVQLYAVDRAAAERIAQLAIAEVKRIEQHFSRYREDSFLSQINRSAGKAAVCVDAETAAHLDYGEACYRKSGGLFDRTSGVLRRAWDFRRALLPEPDRVASLLPLVGWDKVELSKNENARRSRER
jgi:thiamine biosynthesis lipoprotein